MLVDPNYLSQMASAISQSGATLQNLTTELSSGVAITQLSDDPVAAAGNVGIQSSISQLDTFVHSSTAEQSRMQVADSALGDVVTQVQSAISLAVSAGDGSFSSADYSSLESQLTSIRDSVLASANSSYQGQYIFGGSQTSTPPYTLDNTTDPATAVYNGDANTQTIRTPDGQQVPINVPGAAVFGGGGGNLLQTLNQLVSDVAANAAGTGTASSVLADSSSLTASLGVVTSQRATLDSGLSRLTSSNTYSATQEAVYQAQQSSLLSANPATVATDLKTAETQQQALISATAALESLENLFAVLKF
jgi:flagellar hook-associated protein 3 FlgL